MLEVSPGWKLITEHLAEKVNAEIGLATETPLDPEQQRIRVLRWNAMRELLDSGFAFIDYFKKQREAMMDYDQQVNSEWFHKNIGCRCSTPWDCISLQKEEK